MPLRPEVGHVEGALLQADRVLHRLQCGGFWLRHPCLQLTQKHLPAPAPPGDPRQEGGRKDGLPHGLGTGRGPLWTLAGVPSGTRPL